MNMTEKNGQPSMEEILASIRRIIAEEPAGHPHNGELRGTPIMLKGDSALDDTSEFDLPAIFRSSPPPASERQTPLLGRLTDAIRSATTVQPETRASAVAAPYQTVEAVELSPAFAESNVTGLSSLKSVRTEPPHEPMSPFNGASHGHGALPQAPPSGSGTPAVMASGGKADEEPRRVMAPFKDTHFMRMASAPAAGSSSPSPSPAPVADPFPAVSAPSEAPITPDFGTIVPGQFDRASLAAPQVQRTAPVAMPPPPLPVAEPVQHALPSAPAGGAEEQGGIEDATADLLRPMLRQWLSDNMPRMVEKALHIEIAESLKGPKKP